MNSIFPFDTIFMNCAGSNGVVPVVVVVFFFFDDMMMIVYFDFFFAFGMDDLQCEQH
jgi:hypothetical protein